MYPEIITAPTIEIISLSDVQEHCRFDDESEEALMSALISLAQERIAKHTGITLAATGYRIHLQSFPNEIRLPRAPVTAIDAFAYSDANDEEQTLSSSVYEITMASRPARIRLKTNQVWPNIYEKYDPIKIDFTAGYEDAAAAALACPELLHAAKLMIYHWWRFKGVITAENVKDLPDDLNILGLLADHDMRPHG